MSNIFKDFTLPDPNEKEHFKTLFSDGQILVERIISTGQISPNGEWYQSEKAEWLILLEGTAEIEYPNNKKISLKKGDYLYIHPNQKHRVAYTSQEPPCLWLAIHAKPNKSL